MDLITFWRSQHSQQSTHQQTNPYNDMTTPTIDIWISNMYQSGAEIAGYQSGKYLDIHQHQINVNTNSVITACFLPWSSLTLTGHACSVPNTECSIFLNFPNCLIFYVSNCFILQPPPPLPIPIKKHEDT